MIIDDWSDELMNDELEVILIELIESFIDSLKIS